MDPTSDITMADLSLGEEARDLWDPALPHLSQALAGDEADFLAALDSVGRGAGLTQKVPVADLLDAYSRGSEAARARLLEHDGNQTAARRLLALEHGALTRIAAGYSAGLGETIDRLRRVADESSPLDVDSGAMKPTEFGRRLSLEVERCQRMDLPLGLLELTLHGRVEKRHAAGKPGRAALHEIGECLRENLRRYDSVGLTDEGAFVLALPDISRRGLAGAAERIRREIGSYGAQGESQELTFALAHYEFVDANAQEMLSVLGRSMANARRADQPIAWA